MSDLEWAFTTIAIVILIIGIGVSVALHELGHMIPAKKFGVKVPEYFIGFGPRLWSFRRGETEYGVKAIWLGGYVKLVGMLPPARPGRPRGRQSSPVSVHATGEPAPEPIRAQRGEPEDDGLPEGSADQDTTTTPSEDNA